MESSENHSNETAQVQGLISVQVQLKHNLKGLSVGGEEESVLGASGASWASSFIALLHRTMTVSPSGQ